MEDGGGGGGSNTWKYVGIGCGIAALLSICAVGGCFTFCAAGVGGIVAATEAPATAAHGFFTDIRNHSTAAAYGRMSTAYRAAHTEADFGAAVAAIPGLEANTDSTFTGRAINGSTATLTGLLTSPTRPIQAIVTLHDEGGTWVIDSVLLDGQPL